MEKKLVYRHDYRIIYNGDGIRVGKNVNGNIEKYLYDTGNHVVLEVNADGEQTAENIYGIYNIARVIGNNSYTYLHNGHGDVVALVDSEENVVNRYTYDAFGVVITETETVDNPFRYASYWYDSETGLYYLMARYYNPVNGRFLSEDPVMDGYNWYVYCDNNPIMYYDYSGEVAIPAAIVTGIAIVTKIIDYVWTAWDVIDSTRIFADDNEDPFEKAFAAINIVLAAGTEAIEPDDWLPINIPLDDVGRKIALSTLKQKYKNEGPVAVKNYLRKHFGNEMDDAIKKIDDAIDLSVSHTGKWTKGSYDSAKDSLIDHYYRHGAEVGATDVDSYLRKAEGSASNLKNATKHRGLDGFTEGAIRYKKMENT